MHGISARRFLIHGNVLSCSAVFDEVMRVCLVKTNSGKNFERDYSLILAKIFNIKLPRRVGNGFNYVFRPRYQQV